MSLQCFPGLHHLILGEGFLLTPGNAGDCARIDQHMIAFRAHCELWQLRRELSNGRLLTSSIGQFILLALYSILEVFGFAAGLLDARLHLVGGDVVRHVGGL